MVWDSIVNKVLSSTFYIPIASSFLKLPRRMYGILYIIREGRKTKCILDKAAEALKPLTNLKVEKRDILRNELRQYRHWKTNFRVSLYD